MEDDEPPTTPPAEATLVCGPCVPTSTPEPEAAYTAAPVGPQYAPVDWPYLIRQGLGEIDPLIPDAFTGTRLGYMAAVEEAALALSVYSPGNPYGRPLMVIAIVAPVLAVGYNVTHDTVTDTGYYKDVVTPTRVALGLAIVYTVVFMPGPPIPP